MIVFACSHEEPSSALSGTFSHGAARHGRRLMTIEGLRLFAEQMGEGGRRPDEGSLVQPRTYARGKPTDVALFSEPCNTRATFTAFGTTSWQVKR